MRLPRRRFVLTTAAALAAPSLALPGPAGATPAQVADLIQAFVGDAPLQPGKVTLDLPVLVENGNVVAMTVNVDAPPGTVREIAVFADGNPLPEVLRVHLGPASGLPRVSTRIRLATSQTVTAVARLDDGTCWHDSVELLVTLAACIE
ncbi:MAG: thiosulfate oxidation carrier protein SoxY [Acetobacteraceae bacterium]